ncbi:DUF2079 domain-containing protein [Jatrophihabitans sp. YIM 134969]
MPQVRLLRLLRLFRLRLRLLRLRLLLKVLDRDRRDGMTAWARGTRRRLRAVDGWVPLLTAVLVAALYTATSVRRHLNLQTSGFDLGIFTQDVRSWAEGRFPPTSTLKGPGFDRFGDHVSPILAVLAPVYRVFPSPVTLLVVQALLLAVAVVPLMRFAHRRLGTAPMVVVGAAFGLSWGIANAANFEFHEVAFAVPMLAFASVAYAERRDVAAVAWAAPLVLVKEDLGLTLAVLGVLVAVRGRRRLGVLTAVGGVAATAVSLLVIIPAANPSGRNDHDGFFAGSFGHDLLTSPGLDTKLLTLLWLLAPTAFLAVRSSVVWLAVPTLLWRFVSAHPPFWGTQYHYSAVLMPVVFVAFVDALTGVRARGRPVWLPLAVSAAVTVALVPWQSLDQALHPAFWRTSADTAAVHRLLDRVPSGVTVAASNDLAAQLAARDDVSLIGRIDLGPTGPRYAVVDVARNAFPLDGVDQARAIVARALTAGYRQLDAAGGVVLLTRDPPPS